MRSITLIPVGAGSPIIFAKNGQSQKTAPAMYYGRSIGHDIKSNAVASELILPTAFETAQCRFPKINRGRETTLRCQYRLWCGRCAVCTGDRNIDVARTLLAHCLIATVDILNLNKGVPTCKKAPLRDRICAKKPKFCSFLAQHQLTLTCWFDR